MRSTENSPILWVPESFEQRRQFAWFNEHFGYQDIVVISWEGCNVDDVRLKRLKDALESAETVHNGNHTTEFFREVRTGYTAVRALMEPPLKLSRDAAIERLQGGLVGRDEHSCAVISLNMPKKNARPAIKEALLAVAEEQVGLNRSEFHLGGSIIDGIAIDDENNKSHRFAFPSALFSLVLCVLCLKSWRLTLAVIAVAAFGEGLMLAMVFFTGTTMNAVLAVMSPLVFVLTVSAGVHLVNYFHDETRLRGLAGATSRAIAAGWVPCLVAATTTAIGLGSLMVSDIVPIKQFGAFSAAGVMATLGLLMLVVPGAMTWCSITTESNDTTDSADSSSSVDRGYDKLVDGVSAFVCRNSGWITVICLVLMVCAGCGLMRVRTSVSVRSLLVPESETIQDYQWLEARLGPLTPVEVVVHFSNDCELDTVNRLELVKQVQHEITQIDGLDGTMSAATFLPTIPPASARRMTRRVMYRRELDRNRHELVHANWLYEAAEKQSWRIDARVHALGDIDYGEFLDELDARVQPILDSQPADGISATYTGVMPLVYAAQRALLNDLFASFVTALVLVAIVMMLVLRSGAAGLIAMLPNIFPAVVLFGGLGWLDIGVDIGTVMTASVALGIAVDDTIHFLTWFRRELNEGRSTVESVRSSFRHCARAMMHTTVICGVGLLVFTLSEFLPTRRFAWMMFTLLAAALVGDLLLLPALLAGPVGKIFARPSKKAPAAVTVAP